MRYLRQIPVIGEEGQRKLRRAKVLVVGAGGLGSAAIAYLACAGVGKLGIADGDAVEEHNLQRQIIHAGRVGMNKAKSARIFVEELNPEVDVEDYPFHITPDNAVEIVKRYDVVVSCPDDFATRLLLNDTCKMLGKPMVHAAIYAFEGEAITIVDSPCYRCLYMKFPRMEGEHARAVMGFTAGLFGCIQASEAIKLILGMEVLSGRMLRADLRTMEFFEIKIDRNPECPTCSGKLKGIFPENYRSGEIVRFD